jgi:preprotein translocase subunit SecD
MKLLIVVRLVIFSMVAVVSPASASDVELRLVIKCEPGMTRYPTPFSDGRPICVSPKLVMSEANIIRVRPKNNKYVGGVIDFEFDAAAQGRLSEVTEANPGGQLAFLSKGKLITAAMIYDPIRGRVLELTLPDKYRKSVLQLFQDRNLVK